ncbi:MAG: LytTR family transcriptional regulator [Cytophagales bacterium]|nr:LytTR family transcriptional regulator [Cytophagales bacterium]
MKTKTSSKKPEPAKLLAPLEEVAHFTADVNYTHIYYKNGESQLFSYTLKRFDDLLRPTGNFIRIHRSHLVNKAQIRQYRKREVVLKNGEILPISRRKQIRKTKCLPTTPRLKF